MTRILALTLSMTAGAAAQESPFLEPPTTATLRRDADRTDYLAVRGGGSVPVYGRGYTDIDSTDVDYDEMVRPGGAARLEMGTLFPTRHGFSVGGYISIGGASHPGDEVEGLQGTLDFEPLDLLVATTGVRLIGTSASGFTFEAFAGGGGVKFGSLDADFTPIGLSASTEVEVYNRTLRGLGEGGVRIGIGSDGFALQLGVSVGAALGPRFDRQFIDNGRGGTIVFGQAELGIQIGF